MAVNVPAAAVQVCMAGAVSEKQAGIVCNCMVHEQITLQMGS